MANENGDGGDWSTAPLFAGKKSWLFTRPGIPMSITFLDPGNLEENLQAGAIAEYLVQLLAAKLGVATGGHLMELCRDEYPTRRRRLHRGWPLRWRRPLRRGEYQPYHRRFLVISLPLRSSVDVFGSVDTPP